MEDSEDEAETDALLGMNERSEKAPSSETCWCFSMSCVLLLWIPLVFGTCLVLWFGDSRCGSIFTAAKIIVTRPLLGHTPTNAHHIETSPSPEPAVDRKSRLTYDERKGSVAPSCDHAGPLKLAVGIITAPLHFNRRVWIRQKLRVTEARCRGVRVFFVLGSRNHMTATDKIAVHNEDLIHKDMLFVPARDWVPHAVAEKSLAWWQYAASSLRAEWYVKTDDDSLMHLPRLEHDLSMMSALGRSHYYYGVMTWRIWTPLHSSPDGVCGARGDDGPSLQGPSPTLSALLRQRGEGGDCADSLGPFPFADGSLQVLSADLLLAFTSSALSQNFSHAHLSRESPPYWTHEDAGVGYLIFHTAIQQALPLTYIVLSAWRHNKFWINWFPQKNPSLPDGHVINTHKIVTSMMAQIAADAYENTTYAADRILCVDCQTKWGWTGPHQTRFGRVPIEKFACCNKVLD